MEINSDISYQISNNNPFYNYPAHHKLRQSVDHALGEWESFGNSKRAAQRISNACKRFVATLSPKEQESFLQGKKN